MNGWEIERKFLVRKGDAFKRAAFRSYRIKQGYLPCLSATVRVRLRDNEAFLTIKGKSKDGGLSRYEFEKEITVEEAEHLFQLCTGGVIDKCRYLVKSGQHVFEIDEFYGENQGLVLAEVELNAVDEPFEKPEFVGEEVTGDARFYNKNMLTNPFSRWKDTMPPQYR